MKTRLKLLTFSLCFLDCFVSFAYSNNMPLFGILQESTLNSVFGSQIVSHDFNNDGFCAIANASSYRTDKDNKQICGHIYSYKVDPELVNNQNEAIFATSNLIEIKLNPNPLSNVDKLKFEIENIDNIKVQSANIKMLNIKGQLIYQFDKINIPLRQLSISLDLGKHPAGIYLCQVNIDNNLIIKRFTIIK